MYSHVLGRAFNYGQSMIPGKQKPRPKPKKNKNLQQAIVQKKK